MFSYSLLDTIPCQNILGEGVQWNDRDQSIWWTDIQSAKIYSYTPAGKQLREWSTPERVGCFAFCDSDERLLVAFASGIAWFDLASGQHEWIARPELAVTGNRFNDGRADRQGRFWVGSIVEQQRVDGQCAALYCLDQQFSTSCQLAGLRISNSLCWSPDASLLYHADSPTHKIQVFDFDASTAALANPRVFAETEAGIEPDGACVDAEGFLWSAQWGGGRVLRYAPDGREVARVEVPFSQPTCVAFGGPQLDWLLVTSARQGLSAGQLQTQPQAGNLLIFQTNIRGLRESRFQAA